MTEDTYTDMQAALRDLEDERRCEEKAEAAMQESEEDMAHREQLLLQRGQDSMAYWRHDGEMQALLYQQQDIFHDMRQKRHEFLSDAADDARKRKRDLAEKENACYTRMKQFSQKQRED